MALKFNDMTEWLEPLRFLNGKAITLDSVENVLKEGASCYGIPVAFQRDEMKYKLIGGDKDECLVVYNPEHIKDYYHFCILLSHMGNVATIKTYYYGQSNIDARAQAQADWERAKNYTNGQIESSSGLSPVGATIGAAAAGVAGIKNIIGKIKKNDKKDEEQREYYTVLSAMFGKLVEVQYDGIKTGFFGTV